MLVWRIEPTTSKFWSALALICLVTGCGDEFAGKLSIWEAAERGEREIVEQHLAAGTSVNAKGERTWMEATPLHHAVHGGQLEMVKFLIEAGADVNALGELSPTGSSVTPLDMATSGDSQNVAIEEYLREYGAELSSERVE